MRKKGSGQDVSARNEVPEAIDGALECEMELGSEGTTRIDDERCRPSYIRFPTGSWENHMEEERRERMKMITSSRETWNVPKEEFL